MIEESFEASCLEEDIVLGAGEGRNWAFRMW